MNSISSMPSPVYQEASRRNIAVNCRHALPALLDGSGVSNAWCHLQSLGGRGSLNVARDPLHEVGGVLVHNVQHLLVNFLGGHSPTEHAGAGEVAAVTGVGGTHHVLGIEHLLGELGHGKGTVLLGATAGKGSKAHHKEVKTGEGNHVHGKLAEIAVELTRETQGAGGSADGGRHQVVKITVGGGGQLQGTEADSYRASLSIQKVSSVFSTSW